ncbi:DUF2510 domain-containing protein [Mycolicibacterium porcinum]|uniref:DUF2510 domain-containing protein n=1 Tax=Mycolicibacterium porcinum TaxID=39693 RepID=UPI00164698BF|nr:DUF2510 domain-containing protein [Mycolicibacterium porcinum]
MPPGAQAGWFTDPWNIQQIRYFDGQQWTAHVAAGSPMQPDSVATFPTPPVSSGGYPFGEPTLFLQPIRGSFSSDIRCQITNRGGQLLALIQPRGALPRGAEAISELAFEVVRPDGTQLLQFTRSVGFRGHGKHRLQVHDPSGRDLGCLRQTSSYWQFFRTHKISFELEYQDQPLGATKIRSYIPKFTKLELDEPISNASAEIGRVHSQLNQSKLERMFMYATFDYRLDCSRPTSPPTPTLLLATAFAHFLYDHLDSLAPFSRWAR